MGSKTYVNLNSYQLYLQFVNINRFFLYSIQPLDLDKQRRTRIYKDIILYFYSLTVTLVWSRSAIRESSRTRRSCRETEQPAGTDLSQNSRPYIVLKLPRDSHTIVAFPYSRPAPTQYLSSIGHSLHLRIACLPVIPLLILSTARCICQQHPVDSLQIKVIYYTWGKTFFSFFLFLGFFVWGVNGIFITNCWNANKILQIVGTRIKFCIEQLAPLKSAL